MSLKGSAPQALLSFLACGALPFFGLHRTEDGWKSCDVPCCVALLALAISLALSIGVTMFYPFSVARSLETKLADARYWEQSAIQSAMPDAGRSDFWRTEAQVIEIALEVLERIADRHYGVSCHPDADCEHETPDLSSALWRIPHTARYLTRAITSNLLLSEQVESMLLAEIGKVSQEAWAEQNA